MLRTVFIVFALVSFTKNAWACVCVNDYAHHKETLDNALFVGAAKNIGIENLDLVSGRYTINLEILQSYKGQESGYIDVKKETLTSCDKTPAKKGKIYDVIVVKKDGKPVFADKCAYAIGLENWEELRSAGNPPVPVLAQAIQRCTEDGGAWKYNYDGIGCFYKAADAGHSCIDSMECEGSCLAESTEEIEQALAENVMSAMLEPSKPKNKIMVAGKCSPWKNWVEGCKPLVKWGKVSKKICGSQEN